MKGGPIIADPGPLNYLALIGETSLLPSLFDTVLVPLSVLEELTRPKTPRSVMNWLANAPSWLIVRSDAVGKDAGLESLDDGERCVIMLAPATNASLVLMDDRAGVALARAKGLTVLGTLGLLELGAQRELLDLERACRTLRSTTFRCRPDMFDSLLARNKARKDPST